MSKQLTLGEGFDKYAKTARRVRFLGEMERIVPWGELCEFIAPVYPVAGNGRPPRDLEMMLRIYFLQQWFNLSDPAAEDAFVRLAVDAPLRGPGPWPERGAGRDHPSVAFAICWRETTWARRCSSTKLRPARVPMVLSHLAFRYGSPLAGLELRR